MIGVVTAAAVVVGFAVGWWSRGHTDAWVMRSRHHWRTLAKHYGGERALAEGVRYDREL